MLSTLKQSNKLLLNVLDPRFCSKTCVSRGSALTTTYLSQRDDRGKVQITFSRGMAGRSYNVPPSDELVSTVTGIATMCKLPYRETAEGLDAAFVGVPIDTGTSNRPGTRCKHYIFVSFVILDSLCSFTVFALRMHMLMDIGQSL